MATIPASAAVRNMMNPPFLQLDGVRGRQVGILSESRRTAVMFWSDLLVPGVPLIEKIVRPLIVYVALLLLLRLFGKRELAQLNQYDLIVLLTISNTVQNAIIGNDNSVTGGLIGAVTLLVVNYVVVRFLYRHERFDRLIEGNAATLIENGRVLKDRLDAELITLAELEAAAHRQGFDSLDEVDHAV